MTADRQQRIIRIETPHTLTLMNFSDRSHAWQPTPEWAPLLRSFTPAGDGVLSAFGALILRRQG